MGSPTGDADVWEALLAVARHVAGGESPQELSRVAAVALVADLRGDRGERAALVSVSWGTFGQVFGDRNAVWTEEILAFPRLTV